MPRKKLFDPNELEQAILLYLNKGYSYSILVKEFGLKMDKKSFRKYVYKYQKWGFNSLLQQERNHRYSSSIKHKVVKKILSNQLTVMDAMVNYDISSDSTVYSWIKKYTEGKPLTPRGGFPEVYDMKPRKTTFEERLQIVEDYFE
ncbi:MAG: transposase, partial [Aerococcus sp.]|nr:transposase [Aerococcus sp.]